MCKGALNNAGEYAGEDGNRYEMVPESATKLCRHPHPSLPPSRGKGLIERFARTGECSGVRGERGRVGNYPLLDYAGAAAVGFQAFEEDAGLSAVHDVGHRGGFQGANAGFQLGNHAATDDVGV